MNRSKRYNIKDVAKKADVSISTVSHALNDTRYVKAETKSKIKKVAEQLNYRPSTIATGLRRKTLKTIAVFVANIESQFFAKVLKGINRVALTNDYHTIMVNTFYDQIEEEKVVEKLKNQFIDGAVFVSGFDNKGCIQKLSQDRFPFVLVARKISRGFPSILVDNFKALREAVCYLYGLGHRDIGYLTMDYRGRNTVSERFEGYMQGLKDIGISYNPEKVLIGGSRMIDEMEEGYLVCMKQFGGKKVPKALIAATDNLAAGAYTALKEIGLRIPGDVSVIGFDNLPLSKFLDPPLSTVKQPKEEMGACAMNMLLDLMEGNEIKNKWVLLDTKIIERGSVSEVKNRG